MSITFIHTADWQLGKPFARVADTDKRALIRQERINVIGRIGDAAKAHEAAFILVAGDLFDAPTVSKAIVSQACSEIGQLRIPVIVVPGNHDYGGPGCLWQQDFFLRERDSLAPNLRVLLTSDPVELAGAVIFPCPLQRRHETNDPTAALRDLDSSILQTYGDKARIALAHGSIQNFDSSSDDEDTVAGTPNLIDLNRLPSGVFDYIALGDWHGTKQVSATAWYAGTPEPDRFRKGSSNDPGNILVVSAERAGSPQVETVTTARLGWHQLDYEFASDDDIAALEEKVDQMIGKRAGQDLLRLDLRGSLGIEATTRLRQHLDAWESRLLRLKLSDDTVIAPTTDEIEALTQRSGDPLISQVAAKLFEAAHGETEEAALNAAALRELHAAVTASP